MRRQTEFTKYMDYRMNELYKKYRPKEFGDIVGNKQVVKILKSKIEKGGLPHFLLFTGPSGCGKTTLARILKSKLKCQSSDYIEINCASNNGVDFVRRIEKDYRKKPFSGGVRIWCCDEAANLTAAAQEAFLKMLEDTPSFCYFIFCTTDPKKLKPTIHTRASEFKLNPLNAFQCKELIYKISQKEDIDITDKAIQMIFNASLGSARSILVMLDAVKELDNEDDIIKALEFESANTTQAFELLKALMWNDSWFTCSEVLANIQEDPEQLRRYLRACCINQLLDRNKKKNHSIAFLILQCTEKIFFDKSDLIQACYDIVCGGE